MALYVPAGRRKRRLFIAAVTALVVGLVLGVVVGRTTADSLDEQVRAAQERGRKVSAQLRVLSLHQEAGSASLGADDDAGAAFALRRAHDQLDDACPKASWIPASQCQGLLDTLDGLASTAPTDAARPEFARAVDQAASDIDAAFGITEQPPPGG